ncbi:MAG: hypothetical protein ACI8Z1_000046 [Candidatus Azotimanducaceae bacterium]|jgi:hypothetical protein
MSSTPTGPMSSTMTRTYLAAFALLSIGLIAGVMLTINQDRSPAESPVSNLGNTLEAGNSKRIAPDARLARIQELEAGVAALEARLARVEKTRIVPGATGQTLANLRNESDVGTEDVEPLPTLAALVASGIDPQTAEDITIRQSIIQLARLELRDNAIRGEYIGTQQYRDEMRALREQETQIRDEVDETSYDKYLYHTGQTNRVSVESVILGSNAELNGIKTGDMILRYEDKPLYSYRDLRSATTLGEKDERINVTVQRGDTRLIVSLPRGPLGVRLNFLRVDPKDS